MSPYTQYERCVFFPERRSAIADCLKLQDCEQWAACDAQLLVDDWRISSSPSICEAVTLRRLGPAKDAFWALGAGYPDGMKGLVIHMAQLGVACPEDPGLQQALAGCLLQEDEAFAACLAAAQISDG
jgi:hypothetical protein